jgi:hypothetical protein
MKTRMKARRVWAVLAANSPVVSISDDAEGRLAVFDEFFCPATERRVEAMLVPREQWDAMRSELRKLRKARRALPGNGGGK